MNLKYKRFDETSDWYVIKDEDDNEYAVFSLTRVPTGAAVSTHTKHMQLLISEEPATDIIERDNFALLIKLCKFCFDSVLEITHTEGMNKCKIRAQDDMVLSIYSAFAKALETGDTSYTVTNYRQWIVIEKSDISNT